MSILMPIGMLILTLLLVPIYIVSIVNFDVKLNVDFSVEIHINFDVNILLLISTLIRILVETFILTSLVIDVDSNYTSFPTIIFLSTLISILTLHWC
jgi:hypothetical protein